MKIFNKELEKHLLLDESLVVSYGGLYFILSVVVMYVIAFIFGLIIIHILDNYPSYSKFIILIIMFLTGLLANFVIDKIYSYFNKKSGCYTPNPILAKLKNAAKQKDRVNLVKLWKHFNPNHPSDSIVLYQNKKNIELLQKLDDDLVRFIENTDDLTIKLFNLDDFESYQQLYMKYIAPKQKEEVVNKIQTLMRNNHLDNQTNHLIQKLHSLKNEIEKYDIDTKDYFEFKKWNDDTWEMLKLDKNNDIVQNQYQEIMQKING